MTLATRKFDGRIAVAIADSIDLVSYQKACFDQVTDLLQGSFGPVVNVVDWRVLKYAVRTQSPPRAT